MEPYAYRMFDTSLGDIVKREILEPYAHRMFDISLGDIVKRDIYLNQMPTVCLIL